MLWNGTVSLIKFLFSKPVWYAEILQSHKKHETLKLHDGCHWILKRRFLYSWWINFQAKMTTPCSNITNKKNRVRVRVIVFNVAFNNISVLSWQSVEETGVTKETHRPVASCWQTLSHNIVSSTTSHERYSNSHL